MDRNQLSKAEESWKKMEIASAIGMQGHSLRMTIPAPIVRGVESCSKPKGRFPAKVRVIYNRGEKRFVVEWD
jgi:hypothetical protein